MVAHYYRDADPKFDEVFNKEDAEYKEKNRNYYKEYFKDWYEHEITPVFKTPVTKAQKKYTNIPQKDTVQSPGYRGYNTALSNAGLPYDKKSIRNQSIQEIVN